MSIPDYIQDESVQDARKLANNIRIRAYLQDGKQEWNPAINEAVSKYEFAVVHLWKNGNASGDAFREVCNTCSNLLQATPLPDAPDEKLKHVLKLFAYSYLGEKWEDVRRLLIKHKNAWDVPDGDRWDQQVIYGIYKAILYIIRKKERKDLDAAIRHIDKLRASQTQREGAFLDSVPPEDREFAARDLAAYYHLAGAIDALAQFMMKGGGPEDARAKVNHRLDASLRLANGAWELEVLLIILKAAFGKMVDNSIWNVAGAINSRATQFVKMITGPESESPIYELLYPQKTAIRQHLLDPAMRATLITLPTSSGKTLLAEFRILQAMNQFPDGGKVVYVAPTRALVNQITLRLRRDLGGPPLGVKVEKMSGAIDVNSFEENVLDQKGFDVLVTTPEKLNLLIRDPQGGLAGDIVLAIIDEAHNMSGKTRGLNLELLVSNIRNDCPRSALLLMTPFIPNHGAVASWLSPDNPQSISLKINWWRPNDRVVGICYASGARGNLTVNFQPLVTHNPDMIADDEVALGEVPDTDAVPSDMTLGRLAAATASAMSNHTILVLAQTIGSAWEISEGIAATAPDLEKNADRDMVARYVESELGDDFDLAGYIRKGIGVHHAGLPDDIRELVEWLMESGSLWAVVATTTLGQGMNFPVDAILFSSHSYRGYGEMPPMDFWNIAGRAGRMDQKSLGLVGIMAQSKKQREKATKYVRKQTEDLASQLAALVNDATKNGAPLSLLSCVDKPEWSAFLQYISHLYAQADTLESFIAEAQTGLEKTYGYTQMDENRKRTLLDAVKEYAENLDAREESLLDLSDMTGLSVHSVEKAMGTLRGLGAEGGQWAESVMSGKSPVLSKLMDIVFKDIPETQDDIPDIKGGSTLTGEQIGVLVEEWMGGTKLYEISNKVFGKHDATSLSHCVRILHAKVAHSASWGFAALHKIQQGAGGVPADRQQLNLPARVYYGVNTDAAVLMRLNDVPRVVSTEMGRMYENDADPLQATPGGAREWIAGLPEDEWERAAPAGGHLSGAEYQKIWKRLAGVDA